MVGFWDLFYGGFVYELEEEEDLVGKFWYFWGGCVGIWCGCIFVERWLKFGEF